jgi:transcriptional regulator with XRE-family HTH domain
MRKRAKKGTGRSIPQNGAAIRVFRERVSRTRSEFCREHGLLNGTIANIEVERRAASQEMLERLAKIFDVPVEAITRVRDGDPPPLPATEAEASKERPSRERFDDVALTFETVLREVGLAVWLVESVSKAARARYLAGETPSSLRSVKQEVIENVALPEVNRNALDLGRHRPHRQDWVIFGPWLTAAAACRVLGVPLQSLLYYVDRGTVRSMGPPLLHNRIVNAHDIAALSHVLRSPLGTGLSASRHAAPVRGRDR